MKVNVIIDDHGLTVRVRFGRFRKYVKDTPVINKSVTAMITSWLIEPVRIAIHLPEMNHSVRSKEKVLPVKSMSRGEIQSLNDLLDSKESMLHEAIESKNDIGSITMSKIYEVLRDRKVVLLA